MPQHGLTNYSTSQLALAALVVLREDENAPRKAFRGIIEAKCFNKVSESALTRIKSAGVLMLRGDPEEQLHQLPALLAAYEDCGHTTLLKTLPCPEFRVFALEVARSEHKAAQKELGVDERREFDEDEMRRFIKKILTKTRSTCKLSESRQATCPSLSGNTRITLLPQISVRMCSKRKDRG